MTQILINTQDNSFISISAEEANWWKRASPARRTAYVTKHPKSKYGKAVESGKLKINALVEGKKNANPAEDKTSKTKKAPDKKASPKAFKTSVKKAPEKAKKKPKAKVSRNVRAQEKVIEQEEDKRAGQLVPVIQNEMRSNFSEVSKKQPDIVKKLAQTLSPRAKEDVNAFAKPFLKGGFKPKDADASQKRGISKVGQILDGITEGILGRSRYNSTAKTLGHVLLSLFMGPTNYKGIKDIIEEGQQSKQAEFESQSGVLVRRKREELDPFSESVIDYFDSLVDLRLKSLSDAPEDDEPEDDEPEDDEPEQLNTLDTLVGSYLKWFKQLDVNLMAEKLAKLEAIHTMKKEGYKPDPSEVEALLEEEDEDEIPDELNMFESESKAVPRISFKVCPKQKRLAREERNTFDIMYDNRNIGSLVSDLNIKGNGKARRSWKARLQEGFNETAFISGRHTTQPYTLVNSNRILLMNPIHQTFDECKNWVKHTIHKDFL